MSTRNEKFESTLPNHVAHREPRGGGVSQGEAHGRDEIVLARVRERLHSSDPGQQRGGGGTLASPDSGDSGIP